LAAVYPDRTIYHTGYYGSGFIWYSEREKIEVALRDVGGKFDNLPNIIFFARIRIVEVSRGRSSVVFKFEDADDEHRYQAGTETMAKIVVALQNGNLALDKEHGCFSGEFTFVKQGDSTHIIPYIE